MQAFPLVTVITPTYNHEKYIIECIKSLQSQTFPDWDMIIINDGSTDNTEEIVKDYIKNDSRIKLINQENIGIFRLAETYNKALKLAKGKFISILEGDDIWEPDKLARQMEAFEKNPNIILVWGQAYSTNDDLTVNLILAPNSNHKKAAYFNNNPVGSILNILLTENCIPALTITVKKTALLAIGGFHQGYQLPLVDIPTSLELAKVGEFYFIEHPLGKWRTYANQITKTFPVEITKGRFALCLDQYDKLPLQIKRELKITDKDIKIHFNSLVQISYARSGRYKLIRKNFKDARKDYIKAIFFKGFRNPIWRLRALTGYIFSLFNLNIEGLAHLLNKNTYRT